MTLRDVQYRQTMQGTELRKIITTFLVLALLAGSASLAITSISRKKSEGPAAITKEATSQIPTIGQTAFVEDVTQNSIEGYDLAKEFSPSTNPADNYTDGLAKGLAYEFVKTNPEGPDLTSGTGIQTPAGLDGIMEEYVTEAALSPTTYAIDNSRIKIAKNFTEDQVGEYFATVEEIFGNASSARSIGGIITRTGASPDNASIQASNFIFADAQEKLYDIVVPGPAEKFHRAALTYLELNRKLTDLDYTTDPLKTAVFAAKFPELNAHETANLLAAANELKTSGPQLFANAKQPFVFASLLGISTARAAWPVVDFPHIAETILNGSGIYGSWTQMLVEYARTIATQILKNQIVGRMIQQTVKWVQGGGKPQFITNWKKFLKDSAVSAADTIITQLQPQLCKNFQPFVSNYTRVTTQNSQTRNQNQITCTLDQVVQNVKNFYEDFRAGGWLGLASLLEPQNNMWGAMVLSNEAVAQQANESQQAASQDVQANEGFTGFKRCVNYDLEIMSEIQYQSSRQNGGRELSLTGQGREIVGLGPRGCFSQGGTITSTTVNLPSRVCEVKLCRADGYQTTTPGGAVAGQLEKALGGTMDNVVNADDLAGLVGVLIDAAITRLIGLAENGILGLFNGGSGSGTGTGTGTTTGGGTGTGTTEDPDIASLRAQGVQLVTAVASRVTESENRNQAWPGLASSTQSILPSVAMTCSRYSADVSQRLGAIDRIAPRVAEDATAIATMANTLTSLSAQIQQATSAIAIADLFAQTDSYNSAIATLSTRVTTRFGQISALKFDAEENLRDRACNVPLTTLDE